MISITIPTLNSSRTLGETINSVSDQTIDDDVEIVVVDSGSIDNSVQIAESKGAIVLTDSGRLLGARRRGLDRAVGSIIVLLDSDQILRPGSIGAACDLLRDGSDMVVLGERVYQPRSLTERLSDLDKQLLTRDIRSQLDPRTGVMLPRIFRRELLVKAFEAIPRSLDDVVIAHDHAILYFECSRISTRVGYVPDAVWHVEPTQILPLWRKNFRYGWSTRQLLKTGHYRDLVDHKTRPRVIAGGTNFRLRIASLAFLALKSVAYVSGYAIGRRFSPAD
jgi:hypothetical protein